MVGGRGGKGGCVGGRRSTRDRGFGAGFGGEGGELTAGLGGHDGVRVDYVYASEGNALRKTENGIKNQKRSVQMDVLVSLALPNDFGFLQTRTRKKTR